MSITFACPNCARQLRARDGEAGKAVRCPHCRVALRVPFFPVATDPLVQAVIEAAPVVVEIESPRPPTVEVEHRLPDLTAGRTFRAGFGAELGKEAARSVVGCFVFLLIIGAVAAVIVLSLRG